jgi:DNA-binding MarR family transcriptional regulator
VGDDDQMIDPHIRALMLATRKFNRLLLHRASSVHSQVASLDLRPSEVFLLMHLKKSGKGLGERLGLKPSELSAHLGVTAGNVTQIITSLESQGLVTREPDPDDRRVVRILLTEAGSKTMAAFKKTFSTGFAGLASALGDEDCARFTALLEKANTYLEGAGGKDSFPHPPAFHHHSAETEVIDPC